MFLVETHDIYGKIVLFWTLQKFENSKSYAYRNWRNDQRRHYENIIVQISAICERSGKKQEHGAKVCISVIYWMEVIYQ